MLLMFIEHRLCSGFHSYSAAIVSVANDYEIKRWEGVACSQNSGRL